MKNINKFLLISVLALSVPACTDLEEKLRGDITEDINQDGIAVGGDPSDILDGAFAELRNSGTAYHSSYYSVQEISSDEMCIATKGGDWYDGGILLELHRHTYTPTHGFVNNTWNNQYGAINKCNELMANTSLNQNQKAQVRALRAYFYMRLLDLFGNVKIVTESASNPPQSTRAELYKWVESELLTALGVSSISAGANLTGGPLGTTKNAYRINSYGALGILSHLYLNAEEWGGVKEYDKAALCAGAVIDSGVYSLCGDGCKVANLGRRPGVSTDPADLEGYAAVFAPNNAGNPEHIFSVFYDEVKGGGMNFSQMNLHYASQFSYNFESQPWNGYATLQEFYKSYEDGDVRRKNNFLVGPQKDFSGGAVLDYASDDGNLELNYTPEINELWPNSKRESGARPAKFSYKQLGRPNMDNDFPIIRLGDMYLVRAEALARAAGDWSKALPDVNVIRRRAKVAEMTSIDADKFLAERGREMFQEATRRTDLIRFKQFNKAWWEKAESAPYLNLFPIPKDQITASGGTLKQNPGYN
jgi:hypothetical protein